MGKSQEIRELAEKLGTVKERKSQLDVQIKELENRLAVMTGVGSDGAKAVEPQIQTLIDGEPEKEFRVADIVGATGAKAPTVRAALSRLSRDKKINNPRRGTYKSLKNG